MCMVRSPKSIGGIFGLALGNAPYGDCDRTIGGIFGLALGNAPYGDCDRNKIEAV
jgi:Leu/Phe-tRNA-protein transferase